MTKLLLVRHGETAWNAEHRYQGQNDIPLNEVGEAQAAAIGRRLAHEPIDVAYASDLKRAWHTATAICHARADELPALSLTPDPRLRELNFGDWEGLTRAEISEQFPESQRAWQADPLRARLPNGESVPEAAARIHAALHDISAQHVEQTVLIVTHGGVLQIMCCLFCDGNLSLRRRFRFSNASLSTVRMEAHGAAILLLNDTHHLPSKPSTFP